MDEAAPQYPKVLGRDGECCSRIQIYAAITAYCMVAIIQHETKTELSIYEVLETVSMVLTDKTPLYDLLCNSNNNIDNELDESSGPTLF